MAHTKWVGVATWHGVIPPTGAGWSPGGSVVMLTLMMSPRWTSLSSASLLPIPELPCPCLCTWEPSASRELHTTLGNKYMHQKGKLDLAVSALISSSCGPCICRPQFQSHQGQGIRFTNGCRSLSASGALLLGCIINCKTDTQISPGRRWPHPLAAQVFCCRLCAEPDNLLAVPCCRQAIDTVATKRRSQSEHLGMTARECSEFT